MKGFNKIFLLLAILTISSLLVSACAPASITREGNVLTIGTNAEFPPFEYVNEQNEIVGFDIDLAREIAAHLDMELKIENMAFDGLIPALEAKRIDVVVAAMTITDERAERVNFSNPYFNAGQVIVVRNDNQDIQGIDDLREGKKLAVQLGTTGNKKAEELTAIENILTFPQISLAFMELELGRADAIIVDKPVADRYLQLNDNLMVVGGTLTDEYFGIAVHKDNPELLNKINEALDAIQESGKYDELISTWFN